jgi:2-C-methyl-D-erythritol 4-phosphate cytidylyltransferase
VSPAQAVTAVLAAAGSGERLGAGGPKAFVPLAGRPLIEWSLAAFRAAPSVAPIVIACPPGHSDESAGAPSPDDAGDEEAWRELRFVEGGATRSQSVSNALAAVETELVAIHDAARPLLTPELVEGVIATLRADPEADGAIAATPVTDTIKQLQAVPSEETKDAFTPKYRVNASFVIDSTLDRSALWAAQTPQVFRVEALRRVLALALEPEWAAATDEAMLVEGAGGKVLIHPSPPENLKVTTPLDLRLAELLLKAAGS